MNVFLFCIMAQIIEASSEVQASSGGTHCRESRAKRVRGHSEEPCTSPACTVVLCPLSDSSQLFTTKKQEIWGFSKEP